SETTLLIPQTSKNLSPLDSHIWKFTDSGGLVLSFRLDFIEQQFERGPNACHPNPFPGLTCELETYRALTPVRTHTYPHLAPGNAALRVRVWARNARRRYSETHGRSVPIMKLRGARVTRPECHLSSYFCVYRAPVVE